MIEIGLSLPKLSGVHTAYDGWTENAGLENEQIWGQARRWKMRDRKMEDQKMEDRKLQDQVLERKMQE